MTATIRSSPFPELEWFRRGRCRSQSSSRWGWSCGGRCWPGCECRSSIPRRCATSRGTALAVATLPAPSHGTYPGWRRTGCPWPRRRTREGTWNNASRYIFVVLVCHLPILDRFDWHFQASVHLPLSSIINKSQQHQKIPDKIFRECWEPNLGLLGEKHKCFLWAMRPPFPTPYGSRFWLKHLARLPA